jgi:hypothetical protein
MATFILFVVFGSFILLIAQGLWLSTDGRIEGFNRDVEDSIGDLVQVIPHYGHGWVRLDRDEPRTAPEPPASFKVRFLRFTTFSSRGQRRGGIGRVEHPGHELDGYWVAFVPQWVGSWNFTDNVGPCNIAIGPEEPTQTDDVWKAIQHGEPRLAGFCEIRVPSREEQET